MDSRESILQAVCTINRGRAHCLISAFFKVEFEDTVQQYLDLFKSIDGKAHLVKDLAEVKSLHS